MFVLRALVVVTTEVIAVLTLIVVAKFAPDTDKELAFVAILICVLILEVDNTKTFTIAVIGILVDIVEDTVLEQLIDAFNVIDVKRLTVDCAVQLIFKLRFLAMYRFDVVVQFMLIEAEKPI